MERSYSANVRITNVPVCSLRGSSSKSVFGFPIFSQQKQQQRGGGGCGEGSNSSVTNRSQRFNGKSKTDNGSNQC
uniref:Uncharacterized protein n=1 Tax=Tanacetum cinerariifolium TaxID=118510 RepID=A0A699TDZ0_TANCI|nr:hypothetical protein [Tanacetum cinerariifolium]